MTRGFRGVRKALLWAGAVFGLANAGCSFQASFLKPNAGAGAPVAQNTARQNPYDSLLASNSPATSPYAVQRAMVDSSTGGSVRTVTDQGAPQDVAAAGAAGSALLPPPPPTSLAELAPDTPMAAENQPQNQPQTVDRQALEAAQLPLPSGPQTVVVDKQLMPAVQQQLVAQQPLSAVPQPMPGPGVDPRLANQDLPLPCRGPIPREKNMTFPTCYIIEPPDVLLVDAVRVIPKGPYHVEPLDILMIQVTPTLENQPITGPFQIGPDGSLALGYGYGSVRVRGLTLEQTVEAIRTALMRGGKIKDPQVSASLASFRGGQNVRGEHLVAMDGTITLGTYGCVNVIGLSLKQAKDAIERHLSNFLQDPEVSVRVSGYNSKVYYVIADGAGFGQSVYRIPITGNETVLDAISAIGGIPVSGSRKRIWLARPTPADRSNYIILPVDWDVISQAGSTRTNYQLFPGDRVFIGCDPLICFNNWTTKILAPIEQIFGVTLLGASTYDIIRYGNQNNGGGF